MIGHADADGIARLGLQIERTSGPQFVADDLERTVAGVARAGNQLECKGAARVGIDARERADQRAREIVFRDRGIRQRGRRRRLVDVGHRHRDQLCRGQRAVADLHEHFVDVVAADVGRHLEVGRRREGKRTGRRVDRETGHVGPTDDCVGQHRPGVDVGTDHIQHRGLVLSDGLLGVAIDRGGLVDVGDVQRECSRGGVALRSRIAGEHRHVVRRLAELVIQLDAGLQVEARADDFERIGVGAAQPDLIRFRAKGIVGDGDVGHLDPICRVGVFSKRRGGVRKRYRGGLLVDVRDRERHGLRRGRVVCRVGRRDRKRVGRLALEVRVCGQRHLAGVRVDREESCVGAAEGERDAGDDGVCVGRSRRIDQPARTRVFRDRRGRVRRRDRRGDLVPIENVERHGLLRLVAGSVASDDRERVARLRLVIRIRDQPHDAGRAVDRERRVVAHGLEQIGRGTRGRIAGVGRGGGVDHLIVAAVFLDRRRRAARGDRRGHLVEVVDLERDDLGRNVAGGIRRHERDAVGTLVLVVGHGVEADLPRGLVDRERRRIDPGERVGHGAADVVVVVRGGGVDHLAGGGILRDRVCRRAGGDRRGHFVEVHDGKRHGRRSRLVARGIACRDSERIRRLRLVVRALVERHRASDGIDRKERRIITAKQEGHATADVAGIAGGGRVDEPAGRHVFVDRRGSAAGRDRRRGIVQIGDVEHHDLLRLVAGGVTRDDSECV